MYTSDVSIKVICTFLHYNHQYGVNSLLCKIDSTQIELEQNISPYSSLSILSHPPPPTPPPMMGLSDKWLFVLLNSSPFYLFTHCLIMIALKVSIIKSTLCHQFNYTLDYTYLTGCTITGECSNEK